MRSTIALLVVIALAAWSGCGATEPEEAAPNLDFSLVLNGERWNPTRGPQASLSDYGLSVFADRWLEDRFPLNQRVSFTIPASKWRGVGVYPLDFGVVDGIRVYAGMHESDGDAGIARYNPVGGSATREGFEVTRYDGGIIEGRFEGVFVVDPSDAPKKARVLPDTLRVTDGRFRLVVNDRR